MGREKKFMCIYNTKRLCTTNVTNFPLTSAPSGNSSWYKRAGCPKKPWSENCGTQSFPWARAMGWSPLSKKKAGSRPSASFTTSPAGSATRHEDVRWGEARQHRVYAAKISSSRAPAWVFLLTQHPQTAFRLALCRPALPQQAARWLSPGSRDHAGLLSTTKLDVIVPVRLSKKLRETKPS